jgi:hypothetical protein
MAFTGCGGGDKEGGGAAQRTSSPAAGQTPAAAKTPTIEQPGAADAMSNVDKVRTALQSAGFTAAEADDVSGTAEASLGVDDTTIIFYKNTRDAAEEGGVIKRAFSKVPGRGSIRIKGTRVYYLAEERKLKPSERAKFLRIVALSESSL